MRWKQHSMQSKCTCPSQNVCVSIIFNTFDQFSINMKALMQCDNVINIFNTQLSNEAYWANIHPIPNQTASHFNYLVLGLLFTSLKIRGKGVIHIGIWRNAIAVQIPWFHVMNNHKYICFIPLFSNILGTWLLNLNADDVRLADDFYVHLCSGR